MEFTFAGKRALVTGAGKGIGRELAKHLHILGAETTVLGRTLHDLQTLKEECPGVNIISVDLLDWKATQAALEGQGAFDYLVNNAAAPRLPAYVCDSTEEVFDVTFNTNVKAVVNVTQMVARGMVKEGRGGSIVNISSQASRAPFPGIYLYSASKAAVDQLTRCMAVELGPNNVRVNAINPTVVPDTYPNLEDYPFGQLPDPTHMNPLGRWAKPLDLVNAVLFLLSDKSDMINGAILPIDGGRWCK